MTIDECFECKEESIKKNDMGEHGYTTYCYECKIATYHKYVPTIPLAYEIMSRAVDLEKDYEKC